MLARASNTVGQVFRLVSCLALLFTTAVPWYKGPAEATRGLQAPSDPLPTACNPFGLLATPREIDETCGLQGDLTATSGEHAQNRVKNNLCAADTTPAEMTRLTFDRLQNNTPSKAALPWGSRNSIPASDAQRVNGLTGVYTTTNGDTLGEGSYVEFVAYILEGHFGGAESVNCNETTRRNIDIHLALVTQRPWTLPLANYDTECSSVTAEIIPHRRPIDWEILGRMSGAAAGQKLIGAQSKLKDENLQRPVRIRGQLMFDASHSLCRGGGRISGNPARRSGWEIHPVYSIDVCNVKTLSSCGIHTEPRWTPLDQFLTGEED
jgi:hypothetical protein